MDEECWGNPMHPMELGAEDGAPDFPLIFTGISLVLGGVSSVGFLDRGTGRMSFMQFVMAIDRTGGSGS